MRWRYPRFPSRQDFSELRSSHPIVLRYGMSKNHGRRRHEGPPPTIGHFKAQGMRNLSISCLGPDCRHSAELSFARLNLPDDMLFKDIGVKKHFYRHACGRRHFESARNGGMSSTVGM